MSRTLFNEMAVDELKRLNEKLDARMQEIEQKRMQQEMARLAQEKMWKIFGYTLGILGSIATIAALLVSLL